MCSVSLCLPCLFRHHTVDLVQPHRCSHKLLGSSPTYIKRKIRSINLNWKSVNIHFRKSVIAQPSQDQNSSLVVTFSKPTKKTGDKSSTETKGSKETDVMPTICYSRTCRSLKSWYKMKCTNTYLRRGDKPSLRGTTSTRVFKFTKLMILKLIKKMRKIFFDNHLQSQW